MVAAGCTAPKGGANAGGCIAQPPVAQPAAAAAAAWRLEFARRSCPSFYSAQHLPPTTWVVQIWSLQAAGKPQDKRTNLRNANCSPPKGGRSNSLAKTLADWHECEKANQQQQQQQRQQRCRQRGRGHSESNWHDSCAPINNSLEHQPQQQQRAAGRSLRLQLATDIIYLGNNNYCCRNSHIQAIGEVTLALSITIAIATAPANQFQQCRLSADTTTGALVLAHSSESSLRH